MKIIRWLRKHNEFTFIIVLIVLIWEFAPVVLRWKDPQAGEFSIDMLYVPMIASLYFFIALLAIWVYMVLVWPRGYRLLDEVFKRSDKLSTWERIKLVISLFACLVFLFGICLLAVTGISAIM